MMAYDIWFVAAEIFRVVLDLEVWKKFLNSNHILLTTSKLETQCQAAKPEHKK